MRPISPAAPDAGDPAPGLGPPPAPQSWAARYGQAILRDGIATLPRALYLHQGRLDLSAQEVWFVSYILAHKWSADLPYPSLKGMAACTGVDLSWLKRLRRKLQDKSYLEIRERQDSRGGQATNSYDFAGLFAALEDCIAADPSLPNPIGDAVPAGSRADLVAADTSFIARFGRTVAQVGVAAVPQGLFRHQAQLQLTPQQLWFICYILAYQWDAGLPYPSLKRMAIRTGYSEPQLHTIKATLVAQGYLELVHRYSPDKGQDTNGYNFSGLLETMIRYLPAEPAEPGSAAHPAGGPGVAGRRGRKRVPLPAPLASSEGGAVSLVGRGRGSLSGEGARPVEPGGVRLVKGEGARLVKPTGGHIVKPGGGPVVKPGGVACVGTGGAAPLAGGGAASEVEEESNHQESDQQEESNRFPLPKAEGGSANAEWAERDARSAEVRLPPPSTTLNGATTTIDTGDPAVPVPRSAFRVPRSEVPLPPSSTMLNGATTTVDTRNTAVPVPPSAFRVPPSVYSPYIAAILVDFSEALGDKGHIVANVTQALRLWQQSGVPETIFVEHYLYEAQRRTRQAQGAQGGGFIANKMAYFFQTLRELVEHPHEP